MNTVHDLHVSAWRLLHTLAARYTGGSMVVALGMVMLVPLAIYAAGVMTGAMLVRRPGTVRKVSAVLGGTSVADLRVQGLGQRAARLMLAGVVGLSLWMLLWLLLPWPAMQDGALGYLRAAQDLGVRGSLAGSGIDFSTGRWSLLYLLTLMGLHPVVDSMLLPRILSTVGYVALVLRLLFGMGTRARRGGLGSLLLFGLLLLVLATPAGIYAIDDGCTASWCMLTAAALVFELRRLAREGSRSVWPMALWSGFAVLLRPEMLLATAAASAAMYFWTADAMPERRKVSRVPSHIPVLAGAAGFVVLVVLSLILGVGLPIHVTFHGELWAAAVLSGLRSLADCRAFGWGLLAVWGISGYGAWMASSRRMGTLALNATVPVLALLLMVRGGNIDFASEFAWVLWMASLWNTVEVAAAARDTTRALGPTRALLYACGGLCLLLVAVQVSEIPLFLRAEKYRGQEVYDFREGRMDELREFRAVAMDAGFFAYFTQSPVCNPGELVAGSMPASGFSERVDGCAQGRPQYGFVTAEQARVLARQMDLSSWSVCQAYGIPRLLRHDSHLLISSGDIVEEVCAASRGFAVPLEPVLHAPAEKDESAP